MEAKNKQTLIILSIIYVNFSQTIDEYAHVRGVLEETIRIQENLKEFKPILAYTKFERDPYNAEDPGYYDEVNQGVSIC